MQKGERWLWLLVIGLTVLLLIVAAAKYRHMDGIAELKLEPKVDCDLHRMACTDTKAGVGEVTLEISPRPIQVITPLELQVRTTMPGVKSVAVEFTGVDMDMGFNRFVLEKLSPQQYAGKAMLPVCVRSRMTWQAVVLLDTGERIVAAPYQFDTTARH